MDSERRHELQHNSLDTELTQIVEFVKNNINRILTIVIVVLVVIIAWTLISRNIEQKRSDVQMTYENLKAQAGRTNNVDEIIKGYTELANQSTVEWIAADSLLQMGGLYTKKAIDAKDAAVAKENYTQAQNCYEKVLVDYSDMPEVAAYATLGLGKIAEDQGDHAKAQASYKEIMDDAGLKGYPVVKQAEAAYNQSLKFAAGKTRLAKSSPAWVKPEPKVDEKLIPKAE